MICKYILYVYHIFPNEKHTFFAATRWYKLIGNFGFTVRGWGLPCIDDIPISCRKRNTNQWNMQGKDSIGAYPPPFLGQNYTCMQHASIFAYHGHQKARIFFEKKQLPKQHETPWIHWIISPFVSIIWILNRHPVSIKVNPKFQLWTWEFSPFFCHQLLELRNANLVNTIVDSLQGARPSVEFPFIMLFWLVVSTQLKNIRQNGFIFPKFRDENKKSLSCHQLVLVNAIPSS